MTAARIGAILVILSSLAGAALAEDSKSDAITIFPWSDSTIRLTPADKKLTLEYAHLFENSALLYVKASAPLDQDTRIAAFVDDHRLVSSFTGMLQIGWDQRAERLVQFRRLARTRAAAGKLSNMVVDRSQKQLCERVLPKGAVCTTSAVADFYCKQATGKACPASGVGDLLRNHLCGRFFGTTPCSDSDFVTQSEPFRKSQCMKAFGKPDEGCFALPWLSEVARLNNLAGELANLEMKVTEADAKAIWDWFQSLDSKKADELYKTYDSSLPKPYTQLVVTNAADITDAFADAIKAIDLVTMDGNHQCPYDPSDTATVPCRKVYLAVLGDVFASYDRLTVYQNDVSSASTQVDKFDVQLGATGTLYLPEGASVTLRAGYEASKDPKTSSLERCVDQPSTMTTITGKSCDKNALYLKNAGGISHAAYVRLALDYEYVSGPKSVKVVPGIEARFGLEGLSPDLAKLFTMRWAVFATPIVGSGAGRAGVGVDLSFAMTSSADGSTNKGDWAVVPFAFIGATATTLAR